MKKRHVIAKIEGKSDFVRFIERLMGEQGFTYKTLAMEANVSISTLTDLKKGTLPRESTLKRIAEPLKTTVEDLTLRIPRLYKIVKKVKVTAICEFCDKPGTIYTGAPERIKYTHEKCAKAASSKKSKTKKVERKKTEKTRINETDRIRLMPQNDIYLKNFKSKKMRLCLGGCGKKFMSAGLGNRICKECSRNGERVASSGRIHKVDV